MRGSINVRPSSIELSPWPSSCSTWRALPVSARGLFLIASLLGVIALPGCGLFQMGKDISQASWRQFRPKTRDYADPNNDPNSAEYHDEWGSVGSEGRGDQAYEKESDGLTKWVSSPKARSIERNLGIE